MSRRQTITPSKLQGFIEKQADFDFAENFDASNENQNLLNFSDIASSPIDDIFDGYDMDILSEMVWNLTDPEINRDEKVAIAQDIEQVSGYPQQALLQPVDKNEIDLNSQPIDNNAKRELLLSLKPYIMSMNMKKEQETEDIYQATGCRTFRDKASGNYAYREESSGKIISAGAYAARYGEFVEQRRNERWAECTDCCDWFKEASDHFYLLSSSSTTSPSRSTANKDMVTEDKQEFEREPLTDVTYSSPIVKLKPKRKTLSPTQIKNWMDDDEAQSTDNTTISPSNKLIDEERALQISPDAQVTYEAEVLRAEELLFEEWEAALTKFREAKEGAKMKLNQGV